MGLAPLSGRHSTSCSWCLLRLRTDILRVKSFSTGQLYRAALVSSTMHVWSEKLSHQHPRSKRCSTTLVDKITAGSAVSTTRRRRVNLGPPRSLRQCPIGVLRLRCQQYMSFVHCTVYLTWYAQLTYRSGTAGNSGFQTPRVTSDKPSSYMPAA